MARIICLLTVIFGLTQIAEARVKVCECTTVGHEGYLPKCSSNDPSCRNDCMKAETIWLKPRGSKCANVTVNVQTPGDNVRNSPAAPGNSPAAPGNSPAAPGNSPAAPGHADSTTTPISTTATFSREGLPPSKIDNPRGKRILQEVTCIRKGPRIEDACYLWASSSQIGESWWCPTRGSTCKWYRRCARCPQVDQERVRYECFDIGKPEDLNTRPPMVAYNSSRCVFWENKGE
jgi:hypothetical protein